MDSVNGELGGTRAFGVHHSLPSGTLWIVRGIRNGKWFSENLIYFLFRWANETSPPRKHLSAVATGRLFLLPCCNIGWHSVRFVAPCANMIKRGRPV